MGLCDEERISGLYNDVFQMVEVAAHLKSRFDHTSYKYDHLIQLIDQLWHGLLSKNSNGLHWIIGSSADNLITSETLTPWGVAINQHCHGLTRDNWYKSEPKDKDFFDAFDGYLDIPGLLNSASPSYKAVFDIYAWSEQAIYHLRRYDDELLKSFDSLSKLLSDVQGVCFKLFRDTEAYPAAYMLNQILKIVYGPSYPYDSKKWDAVTTVIQKFNMQHYLSRMMRAIDLKALAKMHVMLHKAKKTQMLRMTAALKLAGHEFCYDHQLKDLKEALKKDREFKAADIKKVEALFRVNQTAHKKHEEQQRSKPSNPLEIYGILD
jgi:hypothetical protein